MAGSVLFQTSEATRLGHFKTAFSVCIQKLLSHLFLTVESVVLFQQCFYFIAMMYLLFPLNFKLQATKKNLISGLKKKKFLFLNSCLSKTLRGEMREEKSFLGERERNRETDRTHLSVWAWGYGGGLWLEVWAYMLFMLFKHKTGRSLEDLHSVSC